MDNDNGQLCVTRRVGESVDILLEQGTVRVSVERVQTNRLMLKFTAPRSIPIYRTELGKTLPADVATA
jgi:sRNA-binding carbon storage regulator CsrA